jgi:transposase
MVAFCSFLAAIDRSTPGDVLSGNASDKTRNGKVVKELEGLFKEHGKDIVYVADSALVTKENLDLMAKEGIRFISRIPGTFGVEEAIKDVAWEKDNRVEMGSFSERPPGSSRLP